MPGSGERARSEFITSARITLHGRGLRDSFQAHERRGEMSDRQAERKTKGMTKGEKNGERKGEGNKPHLNS